MNRMHVSCTSLQLLKRHHLPVACLRAAQCSTQALQHVFFFFFFMGFHYNAAKKDTCTVPYGKHFIRWFRKVPYNSAHHVFGLHVIVKKLSY